ncbi:MAG: hypothetical protein QM518_00120 [Verrucomicrobiota bacterium]|nr:hypothetical protein [Verrucomicrobiota bacterium]
MGRRQNLAGAAGSEAARKGPWRSGIGVGVAIAARQNRDSLDSPDFDFDFDFDFDRTERQPFPEGARAVNKLEQGTDTDWLVLGG